MDLIRRTRVPSTSSASHVIFPPKQYLFFQEIRSLFIPRPFDSLRGVFTFSLRTYLSFAQVSTRHTAARVQLVGKLHFIFLPGQEIPNPKTIYGTHIYHTHDYVVWQSGQPIPQTLHFYSRGTPAPGYTPRNMHR